jgi:hypothetical protein
MTVRGNRLDARNKFSGAADYNAFAYGVKPPFPCVAVFS